MRFVSRNGEEINSIEDWERLGKPAADDHWRPGRSAYELAADWIERDAEARVRELLCQSNEIASVELTEGTVEKKTYFDDIPRGPRNHDLLVKGTSNLGPLVVGVEGKADEPFDLPLWRWRQAALARSSDSGAPRRLDQLTSLFFGTTIDKDHGYPGLACLGYQVLSALAGTLVDAREASAVHAVLLIHEFVTDETHDEMHRINGCVLDDFVTRLSGGAADRTTTGDGWITTPIAVKGDGQRMPDSLPVTIAKLVTTTRGA